MKTITAAKDLEIWQQGQATDQDILQYLAGTELNFTAESRNGWSKPALTRQILIKRGGKLLAKTTLQKKPVELYAMPSNSKDMQIVQMQILHIQNQNTNKSNLHTIL